MGQWSLSQQDDVLRRKFKTLVMGAIKRKKLEKDDHQISYETFVKELDEGDSFTATLIDVLVNEMADRRTRKEKLDRRLISEHTAKILRMQAAPLHIYRGRRGFRRYLDRPGFNVAYTDLVAEITDEEDEHADHRSAHSEVEAPLEGVRLGTELYDAFATRSYEAPPYDVLGNVPPSETSSLASRSPDVAEGGPAATVTSPRPLSPMWPSIASRTSSWPHNASAGPSTLTRQNSIRRPSRSRTIDFNEFTQRRRSSIRQSIEEQDNVRAEDSSDGTWRFTHTLDTAGTEESASSSTPWSPGPYASWLSDTFRGRQPRRTEMAGSFPWSPEPSEPSGDNHDTASPGTSTADNMSSSQLLHLFTGSAPVASEGIGGPVSRRASIADVTEARRHVIAPRLRRGGLRPPETLLSRYASPAIMEYGQGESSAYARNSELNGSRVQVSSPSPPNSDQRDDASTLEDSTSSDVVQLPTPRSATPATDPSNVL